MFHSERQVLQSQQDELQHGSVAGGLGVSEPGVEQPVASDRDEPGETGSTMKAEGGPDPGSQPQGQHQGHLKAI